VRKRSCGQSRVHRWGVCTVLFLPILVMAVFAFNKRRPPPWPASRSASAIPPPIETYVWTLHRLLVQRRPARSTNSGIVTACRSPRRPRSSLRACLCALSPWPG